MANSKVEFTDVRKVTAFYEEAFKTLRTNMQFSGIATKSIVVTSCYPNEGKSDVAFQLAIEIGKMKKKVLILDADIRKSSFVSKYQVKEKIKGLSQYLSGQAKKDEILYSTNYEGVDFIFAGPVAPNPSELLEQKEFTSLLKEMRDKYDYVLIDTPPMHTMGDAMIVAKQCDASILVIGADTVSRTMAARTKSQLELCGSRILGVVLNKVDMQKSRYYSRYGYHSYSYYHYYRKDEKQSSEA